MPHLFRSQMFFYDVAFVFILDVIIQKPVCWNWFGKQFCNLRNASQVWKECFKYRFSFATRLSPFSWHIDTNLEDLRGEIRYLRVLNQQSRKDLVCLTYQFLYLGTKPNKHLYFPSSTSTTPTPLYNKV